MSGKLRTLAIAACLAAGTLVTTEARAQARVAPAFQPPTHVVVLMHGRPRDVAADSTMPAPLAAGGFATSAFAQAMASPAGRVARVLAGAAMIAGGIAMDSKGGTALSIAGTLPVSAGVFDLCWLSPIFGGPIRGSDIRAARR